MNNSRFFLNFLLMLSGRTYSMHSKVVFFSFTHIKHDFNSTEWENCNKFESRFEIYGISMGILNKCKFLLKWRCSPPCFLYTVDIMMYRQPIYHIKHLWGLFTSHYYHDFRQQPWLQTATMTSDSYHDFRQLPLDRGLNFLPHTLR